MGVTTFRFALLYFVLNRDFPTSQHSIRRLRFPEKLSRASGRCSNVAEVHLLRYWEARNMRKGGELMSVDMLFVDENEHRRIPSSSYYKRRQELTVFIRWRGVRNLLAAIPPLSSSAAVPHVYRNLNLHPLTVHPRATFNRYHILMERCHASCNLHAHYIHGIHEYFENQNRDVGLDHIRIAAEGFYDNAIYLYGIIMLCSGEPAIGEAMLDSLQWRENKARADNC
ncbi:hypothetical protein YC2023_093227 [Brassica napus]